MAALITAPRLMAIGGGALAELAGLLARLGLARPLIVTDPYIAGSGILDRATAFLDGAGLPWSVFSDTVPDPTTEVIEIGTARLRAGDFDSLVAIGGGSSIDTAKGMSVLVANGGAMRDYKVPNEIPLSGPPIIAIPTTAGTGSEVTRFTVVTETKTDEKMLIAGLACCPTAAIVDFELTLSMPLRLTADTGIDSLTHAIEAYVSRRASPFTDGLATTAMGLIAKNIRTACAEPQNRAAREAMMLGAMTGGDGVFQCERGAGARHEPADRRLFPCAARAVERDAAARDHCVLGARPRLSVMPIAPARWASPKRAKAARARSRASSTNCAGSTRICRCRAPRPMASSAPAMTSCCR